MNDYFFITINEHISLIHNAVNYIELKKRENLMWPYEPMYMDLEEFPPYSDLLYEIFETKIYCNLGYEKYYLGGHKHLAHFQTLSHNH